MGDPGTGQRGRRADRAETVGFEPTEGVTPFTALAGPRTRPLCDVSKTRQGYRSRGTANKSRVAPAGMLVGRPTNRGPQCSKPHSRSVSIRAIPSPIASAATTSAADTPYDIALVTSPFDR